MHDNTSKGTEKQLLFFVSDRERVNETYLAANPLLTLGHSETFKSPL